MHVTISVIILPRGGNTESTKTKAWMENVNRDLAEKDMDMRKGFGCHQKQKDI